MSECSIYVNSKDILVFTVHKSVFGFGVTDQPFFRTERNSEPAEIGSLVLKALGSSRTGVETTGRLKSFGEKMVRYAGYCSLRQLEQDSTLVEVSEDGELVTLIPTERNSNGGYLHKPFQALRCAHNSDAIGQAFMHILNRGERSDNV